MILRLTAGLVLAGGAAACSVDPPLDRAEGSAGGAGASAPHPASGSAEATGSSSSSGAELEIAIVSPPAGMAFEHRWVNVEVAFSTPPSGALLSLEQDGSVIEALSVSPAKGGTASLRLPLQRGVTPFAITLVSPDGQSVALESHLYGGQPVAAALDAMIAAHDGVIWQWGSGDPNLEPRSAPTFVTSVASGSGGVFALDSAGHVYRASGKEDPFELFSGLEDIIAIAPGAGHALFLRADGRLFGAGANDRGQLGTGDTESHMEFVEILSLDGVVAVAASDDSSFAVGEDGHLYAWGSNDEGQLGLGDQDASPHPDPLITTNLVGVKDVAAGRDHVLAVTTDGKVFAWGQGSSGQLGDGSSGILASKFQPVSIELLDRALAVAARGNTSYAVLVSGDLLGWGQNSLAQLGVGDTSPRTRPTRCRVGAVRAVGPGATAALSMDEAGSLHAWGSNASGQLGLPPPPDGPERSSAPIAVPWP
jgi:hypothetical protein